MTRSNGAEASSGRAPGWPTLRQRILFHATCLVAIGGVAACIAYAGSTGIAPNPVNLLTAIAVIVASQLARITLRIGAVDVSLGWAEVGMTAALCLAPPVWTPVVTFIGAGLAVWLRGPRGSASALTRGLFIVSTLTVATGAACAVAALIGIAGSPVEVQLARPETLIPLVAAGVVQFIIGIGLTAAWLASATREPFLPVWLRVARAKRMMMGGTIAVALATAVLVSVNPRWLVVLAPVLWMLHRIYRHQVQARQERGTWAILADATRGLNQLDESGVALAVLRGAARLFEPESVEVVLRRSLGSQRAYGARTADLLAGRGTNSVSIVDGPAPVVDASHRVVSRRLAIGGADLGEIRLILGRTAALSETRQHAFSTFADASASAFHDASTHRTLRAMTARSAYDALHDGLTGLPNRSTLLARGNAELRRTSRSDPVALVLLDLDGLRDVNEALGYGAGDELLQAVARRLKDSQTEHETVGRLGGDEFAMLLLGAPADADPGSCEGYAVDRARWFITDLATPTTVGGVTIAVEASAGVVVDTAGGSDMAELLRRADVALHLAKQDGSRVATYDPARDAFNKDRLALLADLRDALAATDQLVLHAQPVIDLRTDTPISVEALIRWRHPRRGLLQPADFIGTIENSELAGAFTVHVLDLALRLASDWTGHGITVPISVNLCARCTLNPDLPGVVAESLRQHGISARQLVLEITESVAVAEPGLAEQVVTGLRELGVQVSVDDFGTGSASLTFLTRFPIDEVKIDRTFVASMVDSPQTAAIVKATVDLAHSLGMRVLAEGVERPEQRAALESLGVTAAQGFLFHPPLPIDEVTLVLQGRTSIPSPRMPTVREITQPTRQSVEPK